MLAVNSDPKFKVKQEVTFEDETYKVVEVEQANLIGVPYWVYTLEPKDGGDWIRCVKEPDLTAVDTAKLRWELKDGQIEHHAKEARALADQASDTLSENSAEAGELAALSQAHSLACIATTVGESSVEISQ